MPAVADLENERARRLPLLALPWARLTPLALPWVKLTPGDCSASCTCTSSLRCASACTNANIRTVSPQGRRVAARQAWRPVNTLYQHGCMEQRACSSNKKRTVSRCCSTSDDSSSGMDGNRSTNDAPAPTAAG